MGKKKLTSREWLKKNRKRYTNRTKWITDCAKACGVSRRAAENQAPKIWPLPAGSPRKQTREANKKAPIRKIDIDTLIDQERLDHAKIVRNVLKDFKPEDCAYDDTFRRDLEIPQDKWKDVRDMDEFLDAQVSLPNKKRVWCHPKQKKALLKLDGVREVI